MGVARGRITHWLQVTSPQPLNVNLSHAMVMTSLDAIHLFTTAEKLREDSPPPSSSSSSSSSSSLSRSAVAVTAPPHISTPESHEFLPFRLENCTEFDLQCHGLYSRRESSFAPSTSASAASSKEFGPWTVTAHSSLPFTFPMDASPVNQSLLIEFSTPSSSSPARPFPSVTAPFSQTAVTSHRMPGRGSASVVVVTEVFIDGGVKICRVRSRVGVSNRTDLAFEWKDGGQSRGWPTLQPLSTFFLPLLFSPSAGAGGGGGGGSLQLRPKVGGFDFCAPLLFPLALEEETVSRVTCSRTGQPSSSSASLAFSGDFHAVLCGLSLLDSQHLHGPVEVEVTRRRGRGGQGRKAATEDGEGEDEESSSAPPAFDPKSIHSTIFTLRPPVVVENLLATPMELRCLERSKDRAEQIRLQLTVQKGGRLPLFTPSATAASSLCFRLPTLQQSQWSASLPLLGDKEAIERAITSSIANVSVRDDEKRELIVHGEYSLLQGCVVVSLYVPYWIFDETGLGLVVSADKQRLAPMGGWEEFQLHMLSDERTPLHFNFPPSLINRPSEEKVSPISSPTLHTRHALIHPPSHHSVRHTLHHHLPTPSCYSRLI